MKAQGKTFLSGRGDEGGLVRWYTNTESGWEVAEAELFLSDCFKGITLEFSASTNKELHKRVAKLDTLIEELSKFRASLASSEKPARKFFY